MKIGVVNHSSRLTNDQVEDMTAACAIQLAEHVAPAWDRMPPTCVFYQRDSDVPAGTAVVMVVDQPDTDGALGYHYEGEHGEVLGKVFVSPVLDNGGGVLDGGTSGVSVASVLSHELIELFGDADTNIWVDGPPTPQGGCYAQELCDPVEMTGYTVELPDTRKVLVSDFVLPAWFDPDAPDSAPKSFCSAVTKPFTMASGGYMVVRSAPGSEQQVFGEVAPPHWKVQAKRSAASRTQRRLT